MVDVLEVTDLRVRYGDRVAVDGISFRVGEGECYGLLGPNGAGKTSTIAAVCGLRDPDAGSVTVAGRPMSSRAVETKRHIGYVPQEIALYPDLTATENLKLFGRLAGLTGAALSKAIDSTLEAVGLADRAKERVQAYSGGMQRRLNIAAGLLHRPELVVLDEPTVGVDPQSRNAIFDLVAGLVAAGTAVVYTTHYMEEAERLCRRIGIVDGGHLVAEGTRRELVSRVSRAGRVLVRTREPAAGLAARLDGAEVTADDRVAITVDAADPLTAAWDRLRVVQADVSAVEVDEPDLETVFLQLTGRALRD